MTLHHGPVLVYTSPEDFAALVALVYAGHRARQVNGHPITPLQRRIAGEVLDAYRATTTPGHRAVPQAPVVAQLPTETLTTHQVADVLGLSTRQTRRLADHLGARKIAGALVWPAPEVHEYANSRKGEAA